MPLATQLAKLYNVIAIDLPGYGKTHRPRSPLSLSELADIVKKYLIQHELTRVTLIGHSMGCQIVAHIHSMNTLPIEKIILMCPTVNNKERNLPMQTLRLLQDSLIESPRTNIIMFTNYLHMGIGRYLKTSQWMVADRIETRLESIDIPTLLVRGERDYIVPRQWIQFLTKLSPHIHAVEIPDAPHGMQFEFAGEVAKECQLFID